MPQSWQGTVLWYGVIGIHEIQWQYQIWKRFGENAWPREPCETINKNTIRKDGRLNESMKTEQRKAVKYAQKDLNFVPGP